MEKDQASQKGQDRGKRGKGKGSESTSYISSLKTKAPKSFPRTRAGKTPSNVNGAWKWSNITKLKLISWHVDRGSIVLRGEAIKVRVHHTPCRKALLGSPGTRGWGRALSCQQHGSHQGGYVCCYVHIHQRTGGKTCIGLEFLKWTLKKQ
jgi:hypothetical protein